MRWKHTAHTSMMTNLNNLDEGQNSLIMVLRSKWVFILTKLQQIKGKYIKDLEIEGLSKVLMFLFYFVLSDKTSM